MLFLEHVHNSREIHNNLIFIVQQHIQELQSKQKPDFHYTINI